MVGRMVPWIIFILLAAATLASAVLVIGQRNPILSAGALSITLLAVSSVYLTLDSPWLCGLEVLYAGALAVLFLVMIRRAGSGTKPPRFHRHWKLPIGAAVALAIELGYAFYRGRRVPPVRLAVAPAGMPTTPSQYALPVALASLMFVVAILGAIGMARKKPV